MKAICASVNFDLFMVLPRPTAATGYAAKLEFSSNDRSKNKWQVNQSEFMQTQLQTFSEQAKDLGETATKAATDAFKDISS